VTVADEWGAFEAEVVAACDLMNGEIKEAMATLDPQKGPPRPAYRVVTRTMKEAGRRDWRGAREE